MAALVGAALILAGGGALSGASLALALRQKREHAAAILNAAFVHEPETPADLDELLHALDHTD